ncbi:MAG: SCO family protein [Myxococcota bacterium]
MSLRALSFGVVVLASQSLATPAAAVTESGDVVAPKPAALEGSEIVDKLGAKVPLDVMLVDDEGQEVTLRSYFQAGEGAAGKPVVLTLGYYECPMLCSLVLNATLDALKAVSLAVGKDFTVLSVSVNPREGAALAAEKKKNYLAQYGREGAADGWRFHVGTEEQVRRLADAVGFQYRWDETVGQYAHGAGIFFLSPDGTLTRTLFGISYNPTDVKFALMEASRGQVGTVGDKILMSCFQYTPDGQRYGVYVWGVMRLGGILTLLFLGTMLFVLWRKERLRSPRTGRA